MTSDISEQSAVSDTSVVSSTSEISKQSAQSMTSPGSDSSLASEQSVTSEVSKTSGTSALSETSPQSELSMTSPESMTSEQSDTSDVSLTSLLSRISQTSAISASGTSQTSASSESSLTSAEIFCVLDCSNAPFGDFAACDNCVEFYRCDSDNTGERRSCSNTLLFNPVSGQCDQSANVVCATTSLTSPTSAVSDTSLVSEQSVTTMTSRVSLSPSSVTSPTSQTSVQSATSEPVYCVNSCSGVPAGNYPACGDCKAFYRCVSAGTGSLEMCGTSLMFNPTNHQCDLAENVVCATTSASSPSSESSATSDMSPISMTSMTSETTLTSATSSFVFCLTGCDAFPFGRYPDCDNCKNFYDCPGGGAAGELRSCSSMLLFDSTTSQCAMDSDVTCSTTSASSATSATSVTSEQSEQSAMASSTSVISETSRQSTTSQSSETSEAIICLTFSSSVCQDNGIPAGDYGDCGNCQLYVRCTLGGESSQGDCGAGLSFNKNTQLCDMPANVVC
ncbi:mucin-5AC [Aplysia californica]|uniref:Mucin-5AC n=1 Tax=Aplysia californica TaxID=6500 RepID=A0ABM1A8Q3_APLCA|nr:mucin-5AC [Aplysia californica]